jgi:hypothetical protein
MAPAPVLLYCSLLSVHVRARLPGGLWHTSKRDQHAVTPHHSTVWRHTPTAQRRTRICAHVCTCIGDFQFSVLGLHGSGVHRSRPLMNTGLASMCSCSTLLHVCGYVTCMHLLTGSALNHALAQTKQSSCSCQSMHPACYHACAGRVQPAALMPTVCLPRSYCCCCWWCRCCAS